MAEAVIRLMYGRTSLNLTSRKLSEVPERVSRLTELSVLLLNNNFISSLPAELLCLQHVSAFGLFAPQLVCLLEILQDYSLNVLHSTQICD